MENKEFQIEPGPDGGATLKIRVSPGASREGLSMGPGGVVKVAVHIQPEKGKANKAVLSLLAKKLGIRKSLLSIFRGAISRDKVISVKDTSIDELRIMVLEALER